MADELHEVALRIKADAKQLEAEMAKAARVSARFESQEKAREDREERRRQREQAAVDRLARAKERAEGKAAKAAELAAARKTRALERAAERARKLAALEQITAERSAAIAERVAARKARALEREAAAAEAAARKKRAAERADQRAFDLAIMGRIHDARTAERTPISAATAVSRGAATASAVRGMSLREQAGGALGRVKSAAMTGLTLAGGFGVVQGVKDAIDFDAAVTDIAIQGGNKSAEWTEKLKKQVLSLSNELGLGKTDILAYVQAITEKTGNVDKAVDTLKEMGEVAVATGAGMDDLGRIVEDLSGPMNVASKDMRRVFEIWRQQEVKGSMTFKSFGNVFGEIAGSAVTLLGESATGVRGAQALGGLAQIGKRSGVSADEVRTQMMNFFTFMARDPEKIQKSLGLAEGTLGRRVNGRFVFGDLAQVFESIGMGASRKAGVVQAKGTELFGERGMRIVQQLGLAYAAGWGGEKGGSQFFGKLGSGKIASDLAQRQSSDAFQLKKAFNEAQNALHVALIPAFKALAQHMPAIVDGFKFLLSNARELVGVWIMWKAAMLSRGIAGAFGGGGGAAGALAGAAGAAGGLGGAAGPVAGASRLASIGQAIAVAAPIAAAAASMGIYFGRRYFDAQAAVMDRDSSGRIAAARARSEQRLDPLRTKVAAGGMAAWYQSLAGTETLKGIETGTQGIGQMTGKGYRLDVGEILRKRGFEGTRDMLSMLREKEAALKQQAIEQLQAAGKEVTDENIRELVPAVTRLGAIITSLDGVLAQLLRGEGIKVNAHVVLPGTEPGARMRTNQAPKTFEAGKLPTSTAASYRIG